MSICILEVKWTTVIWPSENTICHSFWGILSLQQIGNKLKKCSGTEADLSYKEHPTSKLVRGLAHSCRDFWGEFSKSQIWRLMLWEAGTLHQETGKHKKRLAFADKLKVFLLDNICVIQLFQEGNFPNGSAWNSLGLTGKEKKLHVFY